MPINSTSMHWRPQNSVSTQILPPYLVHNLVWSGLINTHGGSDHNIPCDLHNEHINKLFKDAIGCMGANFTEQASTRPA